jgi:periplasmic divalent cation tolerance protein
MKSYCLIYSTAPSKKEATLIAKKLVEQRLAACVNLFPKIESFYQWRSKVENSSECAMLIKTQRKHFKKIVQCIQKHHSYSVPAIVELRPGRIEKNFAQWISNETT